MSKKIAAIEFFVPTDNVEELSLEDKSSLLDYDISIFEFNISSFEDNYEPYQGKPLLQEDRSFSLKTQVEHWNREISESLLAGNTVVVILAPVEDISVHTGNYTISGTGRNARKTVNVAPASNYDFLPYDLGLVNSEGTSMALAKDATLSSYWNQFGAMSKFQVVLKTGVLTPLVVTKNGNKPLGGYTRFASGGVLIALPYIDINRPEYYKKNSEYLNSKGLNAGRRFISEIVKLEEAIKQGGGSTPCPYWVSEAIYELPKERDLNTQIQELNTEINHLTEQKESFVNSLRNETSLKALLYENGKPLESATIKGLEIIGFKAERFQNGDSEFDVVFESSEGRFVGEAEGKDNKAINIEKLRQLDLNIQEDLEREEVNSPAKGVLFGNAYRLSPIESRADYFTPKCLSAAKRDIALVRTADLFFIAKYLSNNDDSSFARACREAILSTSGVVIFPAIPQSVK